MLHPRMLTAPRPIRLWTRRRGGQLAREALGDPLDDQREGAGRGDRHTVAHDLVVLGWGVPARAVAAQRVDRTTWPMTGAPGAEGAPSARRCPQQ